MPAESAGEAGIGLPPFLWRPLARGLAACLTLAAVLWAVGVPRYLDLGFYPQQFFAAVLALALPVAYLTLPARRFAERTVVPWYDCVAALVSFAAVSYVAVYYPDIVNLIFARPPAAYLPGLIIIVLLLEALRRTTGWTLVIIIAVFLSLIHISEPTRPY